MNRRESFNPSVTTFEDLVCTKADHVHHLVFRQLVVLLRQPALLDYRRVEEQFAVRALDDLLLDGA